MEKTRLGDRCSTCRHCEVWPKDHEKADCDLYNELGFHPDRPALVKCASNSESKY